MTDLSVQHRFAQPHPVRAPRGSVLSCRNWLIEAAYRMLQNNLDPEVAENPDALVVYGGIGKAARNWDCFEAILAAPAQAEGRRDAADPVRQAGRRVPHPRRRAARAARQLEPGAEVGDLGALQRARPQGPDDVRPDDRRLVDLHRQPGHRPGHLRDLRRGRPPALRRRPRRPLDPHRRPRRHGRRAAAGRELRRRLVAERSSASRAASISACARATSTSRPPTSTTRSRGSRAARARREAVSIGLLGNAAEIVPELAKRAPGRRHPPRPGDRPDLGARPRQRLPAGRLERRALARGAGRPGAARGAARRGARAAPRTSRRCSTSRRMGVPTVDYGNNIRQVAFDAGVKNAFDFPRLRAGLHPAAVLPRQGPVPLGRAVRRPGRHPQDRREAEGAVPGRQAPAPLARHGRRAHRVPGAAGAHLLARPGRAPPRRPGVQRDGRSGRAEGADRDRPRPPRCRLGRVAEPRDRSDAATAPTRSPTGRCSTRCSTPPAARPGSRCTTAAASAWAIRSMPAS